MIFDKKRGGFQARKLTSCPECGKTVCEQCMSDKLCTDCYFKEHDEAPPKAKKPGKPRKKTTSKPPKEESAPPPEAEPEEGPESEPTPEPSPEPDPAPPRPVRKPRAKKAKAIKDPADHAMDLAMSSMEALLEALRALGDDVPIDKPKVKELLTGPITGMMDAIIEFSAIIIEQKA